jgi:mannose/fructose/sorbose-specific phosphotransferase system IIA component
MQKDIGIILASHGNFATCALKSLEMIVGKQENIATLALNPGEDLTDFIDKLEDVYTHLDKENGVIIICDIFGGTPSNAATSLLITHPNDQIAAYSGLNLPILLELSSNRKQGFEKVKSMIEETANYTWVELKRKETKTEVEGDL